jgi:hypothetical protein
MLNCPLGDLLASTLSHPAKVCVMADRKTTSASHLVETGSDVAMGRTGR